MILSCECVSHPAKSAKNPLYIYIYMFVSNNLGEPKKPSVLCFATYSGSSLRGFFAPFPADPPYTSTNTKALVTDLLGGKIHRLLGCGKKPSRAEWPHEQVLQGFQPTTASPFPVRTQDWSIRSSPKPSTFRSAKKDTRCEVRHTLCGKILAMIAINPGLRDRDCFFG